MRSKYLPGHVDPPKKKRCPDCVGLVKDKVEICRLENEIVHLRDNLAHERMISKALSYQANTKKTCGSK